MQMQAVLPKAAVPRILHDPPLSFFPVSNEHLKSSRKVAANTSIQLRQSFV